MEGVVKAVDGINLDIQRGETIGVVGESGCGKSVTAFSIMRIIPNPGRIVEGVINFEGKDLLSLPSSSMRQIRGKSISMIFQEPMTSLNPVFTIGHQIAEVFKVHHGMNKKDSIDRAIEMLEKVGIPSPQKRVHEFPHQLSGGMRQRVMIAMALACNPKLLIADEPTTALDVTIQAQILDLMAQLKDTFSSAIMLITHNLGVIAEMAERVVVMYAGRVVEEAPVEKLFEAPLHPYTKGLLQSIPRLDQSKGGARRRLHEIPGVVPNLMSLPIGCKFLPRCPAFINDCRIGEPTLEEVETGHYIRCWRKNGNGV